MGDAITGGQTNFSAHTLREAVNYADKYRLGAITINFNGTLAGQTITLAGTLGALQLSNTTESTTLSGNSLGVGLNVLTISGGSTGTSGTTVFDVPFVTSLVTATISDLDITERFSLSGGGGIFNEGNLTLTACAVTACTASVGGGIDDDGGTLTLTNCTISGDSTPNPSFGEPSGAYKGGGIYNSGKLAITGGTVGTIGGSTISTSDFAYSDGGGIFNSSTGNATVTSCTIDGDQAYDQNESSCGGGIYSKGDGVELIKSTYFTNDTASSGSGGGVLGGGGWF